MGPGRPRSACPRCARPFEAARGIRGPGLVLSDCASITTGSDLGGSRSLRARSGPPLSRGGGPARARSRSLTGLALPAPGPRPGPNKYNPKQQPTWNNKPINQPGGAAPGISSSLEGGRTGAKCASLRMAPSGASMRPPAQIRATKTHPTRPPSRLAAHCRTIRKSAPARAAHHALPGPTLALRFACGAPSIPIRPLSFH